MKRPTPPLAGLIQAIALCLYVTIFVTVGMYIGSLVHGKIDNQPYAPALFLLAFCFSALVCGTVTLGYPVILLMEKRIKTAALTILWTLVWIALFVGVFLVTR